MVYVVCDNKIIFEVDAWEEDSVDKAYSFISNNGKTFLSEKITSLGDMVITVK